MGRHLAGGRQSSGWRGSWPEAVNLWGGIWSEAFHTIQAPSLQNVFKLFEYQFLGPRPHNLGSGPSWACSPP